MKKFNNNRNVIGDLVKEHRIKKSIRFNNCNTKSHKNINKVCQ